VSRIVHPPSYPAAARPPRARTVRFWFDDQAYEGMEGEPVAAALWAAGVRDLGRTEATGAPRGLYCAIGHCFECRVRVGDRPDRRACLEPVREGLRVYRQAPPPPLPLGDGGTPK
jgi:sarcosine oxidase subunit alpha